MRKLALVVLACLGAAACNEVTTGTARGASTGATAGSNVAGPVGALVGGTVGGATGAVAGATVGVVNTTASVANAVAGQPGRCYATDRNGNVRVNRAGEPLTVRC